MIIINYQLNEIVSRGFIEYQVVSFLFYLPIFEIINTVHD